MLFFVSTEVDNSQESGFRPPRTRPPTAPPTLPPSIFIYFPIYLFTAHLDLEFLLYYFYSIRIPDHTVWRTLGRESNPGRVVKAHGKPLDHHTFLCLDCLRSNVVYVEGASLSNVDLATCQASCKNSPTCTFYTWNTVTQVGLSHLHLLHLEHSDTGRSVPPAPSTPEAQ